MGHAPGENLAMKRTCRHIGLEPGSRGAHDVKGRVRDEFVIEK
jgi:hypothetical protein